MKNNKFIIVALLFLGIFCVTIFALQKENVAASNEIDLKVNFTKNVFQLGEIVSIETKITNNALVPIYLNGNSPNFAVFKIAFKEYKKYKFYAPEAPLFTLDGADTQIKLTQGEALSNQNTILWNSRSSIPYLASDPAKPLVEARMLTDYAFPEAGIYFIKATTGVQKNGKPVLIESEPIKITITEPEGEDLEVWNKIKDNGQFAHFLQEGDLTRGYHTPEERAKFQAEVEEIINTYPNSFYANSLRQSLTKFEANEAKRKAFQDSLKQPK